MLARSMAISRRRRGLAWAALWGFLGALHGGCAVRARRSEPAAVVDLRPSPSMAAERAEPARSPGAEPPKDIAVERVPSKDAGCPAKIPESWSPCGEPGRTCRYPCASEPSIVLEVVCAYDEKHWVPHYELNGVACP